MTYNSQTVKLVLYSHLSQPNRKMKKRKKERIAKSNLKNAMEQAVHSQVVRKIVKGQI